MLLKVVQLKEELKAEGKLLPKEELALFYELWQDGRGETEEALVARYRATGSFAKK